MHLSFRFLGYMCICWCGLYQPISSPWLRSCWPIWSRSWYLWNLLQDWSIGCEIALLKTFGDLYIERTTKYDDIYTNCEPRKFHRNFSNSSRDKLHKLLKFDRPWKTNNESRSIFQYIETKCDACRHLAKAPNPFSHFPNRK